MAFITTTAASISSGGTINGDITITGDLKVEGDGTTFAFDEIVQGTQVIEKTDTEAFLVRKASDGGDVFVVDSTNNSVILPLNASSTSNKLKFTGDGTGEIYRYSYDMYYTSTINHYFTGSTGLVLRTSDDARKIFLSHSSGTKQLYTNISDFTILAGHSGAFGFLTTGSTSTFKAIESVHTDNNTSGLKLNYKTGGTDTAGITISSAGKVGIGTTSPDSGNVLHIKNTSGDNRGIIIENTVATSYTEVHFKGAKEYRIGTGGSSTSPANRFYIYDAGANAHRLDIDTNGDVGIGTTAPGDYNAVANKLVVADSGNSGITIASGTSNYGALYFADGTSGTAEYMGGVEYYHNDNVMKIWANADTDQLVLGSSGNVGIGTTSPSGDGLTGGASPAFEVEGTYPVIQVSDTDVTNGKAVFATNGGLVYLGGTGAGTTALQLYVAGNLRFKIDDNSRISLSNNDGGTSNTVFGKSIGDIDAGSNYNVFIGEEVASDGTLSDATNNVVIGYQAGEDITTADNSVMIGYQAGQEHSQGSGFTAIGYRAGYDGSGLNNWGNTFIGYESGSGNWAGASNGNVGVGYETLTGAMNDADYNTAVGYQAGLSITLGDQNTLLGYKAGVSLTEGTVNVAIGGSALLAGVSNHQNVAVGNQALTSTTSDSNVAVGEKSGLSNTSGTFNVAVGRASFYYSQTGSNNTAIGYNAQFGVSGNSHSNNTSVGHKSMYGITTGSLNVALGEESLKDITTGHRNTMAGYQSGENSTTGAYNTALGYQAMRGSSASGQTGDGVNVAIGYNAMQAVTTATNNVAIGGNALDAYTSGDGNVAIGRNALGAAANAEDRNVAIGRAAMSTTNNADSDHNVAIGASTLQSGTVATGANVAIGHTAMTAVGAVGSQHNTAVGYASMNGTWATTMSQYNVAIGSKTMQGAMNDADNNTAVGYQALKDLTTGDSNTALGSLSGENLTTGSQNTLLGSGAGYSVTTGQYNTLIGVDASNLHNDVNSVVAVGWNAGKALQSDGTVAIGYQSGVAITSGSGNITIGYQAGDVLTTGADNIIIGYGADVDANDRAGCIVIGKGLSLNTASDNVVEIGNNTNSMTYDLDGGDITVTSDVRTKKNIKGTKLGLEFINKLRPITYQTKPSSQYPKEFGIENPSKKSSGKTWDGLIAQEVKEAMDEMNVEFSGWEEGVNTKQRLAYGKFVMPLIKAVQELSAEVKQLKKQLEDK